MNDLVTIKISEIPGELAIVKSYLDDKGIFSYLKDELMFQVHPYAIGGVKLQVKEEDREEAINFLIEGGFAKKEDYEIPQSTLKMADLYEKISRWFSGK
ncbi:hypothetical protein [Prevotella sp. 10(H)]|uniref:hypothetical protein n=1 Tax=Prevotella sp. 10(H) TaxID=1158294 RepID=UPI00068E57FF|nr:hypothetical protein [Prevotella sp. 10(H)]